MESAACWVGIFILGLPLVIVLYMQAQKRKLAEQAYADYQQSLSKLKKAPQNADLKQATLALGRKYVHLVRDQRSSTFDEMALMNDINAATTTSAPAASAAHGSAGKSVEERIAELTRLKEKGILSEEEFREQKKKILQDL